MKARLSFFFVLFGAVLLAACQSQAMASVETPEAIVEMTEPGSLATPETLTPTVPLSMAAQPAGESPAEVAREFYTWYLGYLGDPLSGELHNPVVDGAYRTSPYLSQGLVRDVDQLQEEFHQEKTASYDPFLLAQDIPQAVQVEAFSEMGNQARVIVHQSWGETTRDLTVDLIKESGAWKLDGIQPGSPATPDGVTQLFYDWYLSYLKHGNPLVDKAYQQSEYLSPKFVQQVDETLASSQGGGYDPILMAQDIPAGMSVEAPEVAGDQASVAIEMYYTGNPDPHRLIIKLEKIDRFWKIMDVSAENKNQTASMPEEVVSPLLPGGRCRTAQPPG